MSSKSTTSYRTVPRKHHCRQNRLVPRVEPYEPCCCWGLKASLDAHHRLERERVQQRPFGGSSNSLEVQNMAAIEAIHKITRWKEHGFLCAFPCDHFAHAELGRTHQHWNSRSPLFANRNNGPQLDAKLVPQSTLPDDRESCFPGNLRKEQTARLERLLSEEPVLKFAQRATRILINKKIESRTNLKDLSKQTEIMDVPPNRQMTLISVDGTHTTFAFMFQNWPASASHT